MIKSNTIEPMVFDTVPSKLDSVKLSAKSMHEASNSLADSQLKALKQAPESIKKLNTLFSMFSTKIETIGLPSSVNLTFSFS